MTVGVLPSCRWPGYAVNMRMDQYPDTTRQVIHGTPGVVYLTPDGFVHFKDAGGYTVTSHTPAPLGQWVRIEASRHAVRVTPINGEDG